MDERLEAHAGSIHVRVEKETSLQQLHPERGVVDTWLYSMYYCGLGGHVIRNVSENVWALTA